MDRQPLPPLPPEAPPHRHRGAFLPWVAGGVVVVLLLLLLGPAAGPPQAGYTALPGTRRLAPSLPVAGLTPLGRATLARASQPPTPEPGLEPPITPPAAGDSAGLGRLAPLAVLGSLAALGHRAWHAGRERKVAMFISQGHFGGCNQQSKPAPNGHRYHYLMRYLDEGGLTSFNWCEFHCKKCDIRFKTKDRTEMYYIIAHGVPPITSPNAKKYGQPCPGKKLALGYFEV